MTSYRAIYKIIEDFSDKDLDEPGLRGAHMFADATKDLLEDALEFESEEFDIIVESVEVTGNE